MSTTFSRDLKAIVLAGGRGKRLNELSSEKNKCMIEVAGKPLIEFSLNSIAQLSQISEIILVVGYQAESIINRYGISYKGKRIRYRIQVEQKGLVHAIDMAGEDIGTSDFMLFLGDEIVLGARYDEMIQQFEDTETFGICGMVNVEQIEKIQRTYTVAQTEDSTIYRLVEKPRRPFNHWMGTGNCLFRNQLLDYIDIVPIHHLRHEKELPDLIQCAIDDGNIIKSFDVCEYYTNVNSPQELTEVEKYLASNMHL